jgi:hypothetical protein
MNTCVSLSTSTPRYWSVGWTFEEEYDLCERNMLSAVFLFWTFGDTGKCVSMVDCIVAVLCSYWPVG